MQVDTPQKTYHPVKRNTTTVLPAVPVKPVLDDKEHPVESGKRGKRRPASAEKDKKDGEHFDGFA